MAKIKKIKIGSTTYDVAQDLIVNTTYANLVYLKNSNKLTPGTYYRITDYVTTTVQAETQSAGHAFDVIVKADDVNILNENASAAIHSGDFYFANSKLEVWELKYCLENDPNRFAWADIANGKGVIYYMKDEFNNECSYDFKNILFNVGRKAIPGTKANVFYYTFSIAKGTNDSSVADHSLNLYGTYCYSNKIGMYITPVNNSRNIKLNNIVFRNDSALSSCVSNIFESNCYSNTFGNGCNYNTFRNMCYNNTFGSNCNSNTFICYCCYNIFESFCESNTFKSNCYNNTFGLSCISNTFGNQCFSNTFEDNCCYNTFENDCQSNTFKNDCQCINLFRNDENYQHKDNTLYPISHPDISTQPSLMPQRFGNKPIKEIASRVDTNGMLRDVPKNSYIIKCTAISDNNCTPVTLKKMLNGWKLSNEDIDNVLSIGGCDFVICQYYEIDNEESYGSNEEHLCTLTCTYNTSLSNEKVKLFNKMTVNYESIDGEETEVTNKFIFSNSGTHYADFITKDNNPIRDNAFKDCTVLKTIDLDEQTYIGDESFVGCTNLDRIYNYSYRPQEIYENTFDSYTAALHVLKDNSNIYRNHSRWGNFSSIIDDLYTEQCGPNARYYACDYDGSLKILGTGKITSNPWASIYGTTKVRIGNGITEICNNAFELKAINNVFMPNTIKKIGENAFYHCTKLTSITIPNGVEYIGESAFEECSGLTSIEIPNSVETMGRCTFLGCTSLTSAKLNSLITIPGHAFENCTSLTSVEISNGVRYIGESAFKNCNLLSVTLPNSISLIDANAFTGNPITSINIPNCYVEDTAFNYCSSLTEVTINSNNITSNNYQTIAGIFGNLITKCTLGPNVRDILYSKFINCINLTTLEIGQDVSTISNTAFQGCSALTTVTIKSNNIVGRPASSSYSLATVFGSQVTLYILGENISEIGSYKFYNCSSLTSITIPKEVTDIGDYAFSDTNITEIHLGDKIQSIGTAALPQRLYLLACKAVTPPTLGQQYLLDIGRIYVPNLSVNAYKSAPGWSQYATYINGGA